MTESEEVKEGENRAIFAPEKLLKNCCFWQANRQKPIKITTFLGLFFFRKIVFETIYFPKTSQFVLNAKSRRESFLGVIFIFLKQLSSQKFKLSASSKKS